MQILTLKLTDTHATYTWTCIHAHTMKQTKTHVCIHTTTYPNMKFQLCSDAYLKRTIVDVYNSTVFIWFPIYLWHMEFYCTSLFYSNNTDIHLLKCTGLELVLRYSLQVSYLTGQGGQFVVGHIKVFQRFDLVQSETRKRSQCFDAAV